ncbi:Co2+/Mg2+ efflux protein ApaG [Poriferisphaera sp. WC338]|uniref:Co2+/Mg2+ efflux protein ApaG n=1 Tax=Poriferisphaera sp. WC338 TaxID=3425129 RepID=UPI003D813F84
MGCPEFSDTTTHDIRVGASAYYLPDESDPDESQYFFGYRILIQNNSDKRVQLLSRHWHIIDGEGDRREVQGNGVVGEQPILEPGNAFKYTSFCQLPTHWGTMEGVYHMRDLDHNESFEIAIGRFWLTTSKQAVSIHPDDAPPET